MSLRIKGETLNKESLSDECVHHWILAQPNGPTSNGVCKHCGVSDEFRNSMPGSGWDRGGQAKKVKSNQK